MAYRPETNWIRIGEFQTSRDAVGEQRWEGFPAYIPVSPSTLAAAVAVDPTGRSQAIAPAQHPEIRRRARDGESLRALARVYGVSLAPQWD
jgi:hypothetical protein